MAERKGPPDDAGGRARGAPASCNGLRAGRIAQTYFVGADPRNRREGARHFGINRATE